ncbi:MAG: hypothetical protein ACK5SX_12380 [Sandaracinobacter sp.]
MLRLKALCGKLFLAGIATLAIVGCRTPQPAPPDATVAAQLEKFFVEIGTECTPKFRHLFNKKKKNATPREIADVLNALPADLGKERADQYASLPVYFGIVHRNASPAPVPTGHSITSIFEPRDLVGVEDDLTPFGRREYDCASMMHIGSEAGINFGVGDLKTAIERTTSANTLAFVVVGTMVSPLDPVLNKGLVVAPGVDQSLFRRQTLFRLWNWYQLPQNASLVVDGDKGLLSVVTTFDGYAISKLSKVNGKLLLDATGSLSVPLAPLRNSTSAQRHFETEQSGRASIPTAGVVKPKSSGLLPGPSKVATDIAEEMKGKLVWKTQPEPVFPEANNRQETVMLPGVPAELCRDDLWRLDERVDAPPAAAAVTGRQMRPVEPGKGCEVVINFNVSATPADSGQMLVPLRLVWPGAAGAADGLRLSQDLQLADYRAPASIEPTQGIPVSAEGQLNFAIRELPGWQVSGGTQPRLKMECKANEGSYTQVAVNPGHDIKPVAVQQGPNGNKYFGLAFSKELFERIRATPSCKISGSINFYASHPRSQLQVSLAVPDTTFEALQPATPPVIP